MKTTNTISIGAILFAMLLSFLSCIDPCKKMDCENCVAGQCICDEGCYGENCEICPTMVTVLPPVASSMVYPLHFMGDRYLDSDTAYVFFKAQLIQFSSTTIGVKLFYRVEERYYDLSAAESEESMIIYTAPQGFRIFSLGEESYYISPTIKQTNEYPIIVTPETGPIQRVEISAKTSGEDLGGNSPDFAFARVTFRAVEIQTIQVE